MQTFENGNQIKSSFRAVHILLSLMSRSTLLDEMYTLNTVYATGMIRH
jgi:hypothetical protein